MSKKTDALRRFSGWVNGETAGHAAVRREAARIEHKKLLPELDEQQRIRLFSWQYKLVALVVCLTVVAVLLYTVFHLPLFGDPENPAVNEVVQRYVEDGLEETGAVNMVAGMILDYRAFDTFGESSVLFLAVTSVMMLLLRDAKNIVRDEDVQEEHERIIERQTSDIILQKVTSLVMPCIMLFGAYVVLNGHISPGGGFSGGAVMGAGLILLGASFGIDKVRTFFTMKTFRRITSTALLCYAASKAYSFFTGANGLETGIPLGTPGAIFSSGLILVLDICVGMVVACTMYGFYVLFSRGEI